MKCQTKILVVSSTGIGDTIFSTPGLKALKLYKKNVHLTVLTSPTGAQVLAENPYVDTLIVFSKNRPTLSAILKLIFLKPEYFLLFHNSASIYLHAAFLSRPKTSYAIEDNGLKGFNSKFTAVISLDQRIHTIEKRLHLTAKITKSSAYDNQPSYFISNSEANMAASLRKRLNHSFLLFLQIDAQYPFKTWRMENYIELTKMLSRKFNVVYILSSDPNNRDKIDHLSKFIDNSLLAATNLRSVFATISVCDLVIAADTGMGHVSSALSIPTISLFSPSDPKRTAPRGEHSILLYEPPPCIDNKNIQITQYQCFEKQCNLRLCMNKITPRMVYDAAENFLELKLNKHTSPQI